MSRRSSPKFCGLIFIATALLFAGPVYADKPEWAGDKKDKSEKNEKKEKKEKHDKRDDRDGDRAGDHDEREHRDEGGDRTRRYFTDNQRIIVREYYDEQFRGGRCPPGLAKKHNGCLPPGQAKKWYVGRPIPRDVVYYEVPPTIVVRLGPPPSGQRYVRVASDILLITVGTGMVLDALQDLQR